MNSIYYDSFDCEITCEEYYNEDCIYELTEENFMLTPEEEAFFN